MCLAIVHVEDELELAVKCGVVDVNASAVALVARSAHDSAIVVVAQ